MTRWQRVWTVCLLLVLQPAWLRGESKISFRQITRTRPIAVQRGKSASVEVSANFSLNHSHSAFFVPAGVRMKQVDKTAKKVKWKDPEESDIGQEYRFVIEVPSGQLPGVREYRIATDQSVSSVGHLLVTDFPVVVETDADNSLPGTAQRVGVPAAVCGVIEAFEDVDHFRISGRAGQELVCQIYAQRVTRSIHCMAIQYPKIHLMDAYLTLRDPRGRVIAENDNFIGGDSLLHCRLPASGEYDLEVRDSRYAGDPRYVYCVEISERPVTLATFPIGIELGASTAVELIRSRPVNVKDVLESAGRVTWQSPAAARAGWERVWARGVAGEDNPVPRLVSRDPQLAVSGQNLSLQTATRVKLPVGLSGRFQKPGQTHYFRFSSQENAVTRFDVQSQQQGFAVDSVLQVLDAGGKRLAASDDGYFTKDARLYFRAPATGEYVVALRDLNRRAGTRFVYHLQAEPSGPDFEIHGEYYYGMLAPGGHVAWFVRLNRLNGFGGPVEILVDNLPAGVTCQPATIPAGMDHCALVFSADKKASVNASLVRVRGKARLTRAGGSTIEAIREAHVLGELRRAGASRFVRRPIKSQLLGVTRPLDLHTVTASPSELSLSRGKTAKLKVRIKRSPEYSDQVLLDMALFFFNQKVGEQLPPGVTLVGPATKKLTGEQLETTFTLQASKSAMPVKRLPIAAVARVPITYSIMTSYASNPVFLTVTGTEASETGVDR